MAYFNHLGGDAAIPVFFLGISDSEYLEQFQPSSGHQTKYSAVAHPSLSVLSSPYISIFSVFGENNFLQLQNSFSLIISIFSQSSSQFRRLETSQSRIAVPHPQTLEHHLQRCGAVASVVARALASHRGPIPGRVTPRCSHVGNMPDDAAGLQVFSRISRSPRICTTASCYCFQSIHFHHFAFGVYSCSRQFSRLKRSLPTKVNRVQFPAGVAPGFSCRTMPLVGRFSRGSPIPHALAFRHCSIHGSRRVKWGCFNKSNHIDRIPAEGIGQRLTCRVPPYRPPPSNVSRLSGQARQVRQHYPTSTSHIRAACNVDVLRADVGEARCVWSSAGMKGRGRMEDTRENPPISGVIRHDSSLRKSGGDTTGNLTRFD
ncbi:hypothetical protein PR048_016700 [Dryococelus australis]|uniref:Uncharacterized protein n=1 Tax=Dryococelus australis TaxID=614101 RepID=A0ABQ9H7D9_9NEOP|nr:hypothetical protein PR048_016700 [Dryococelus australis]